jgi:hypothetical protein
VKLFAFLVALLPAVVVFCIEEGQVIENSLRSIFSSDFGYTLVGAKPVSLDDSYDWYLDFYPELQRPVLLFLANTFKNSDNYIFRSRWYGRELVHKKSLLSQIDNSIRLRSFIKQKFGTTEKFFEALEQSSTGVFDLLDRDDVLIGIALGYGEENGEFYARRLLLGHYLKKYPLFSMHPFQWKPGPLKVGGRQQRFRGPYPITPPPVIPEFGSLEREWQWIRQMENTRILRKDPKHCEPYYLHLPLYISRSGGQSDTIYTNFIAARDRLAELFCGRKFSEVIAEEAKK